MKSSQSTKTNWNLLCETILTNTRLYSSINKRINNKLPLIWPERPRRK